jgi:hypothetical protein
MKRPFICTLLGLSLLSSSTTMATGGPSAPEKTPEQIVSTIDSEITAEEQQQLEVGAIAAAQGQENVLAKVIDLAAKLEKLKNAVEATRGINGVRDLVEHDALIYEETGVGKIDYRYIENDEGELVLVPRVVLDENQKAYLLIDAKKFTSGSQHLKMYIARTLMEAGERPVLDKKGRPKKTLLGETKLTFGRDVDVLYFNDNVLEDVHSITRPKATEWRWWKEYFYSKYTKPSADDFTMALFLCAGLQGTLVSAVSAIKSHILGVDFSWTPTIFTMLYALAIDTYVSTYKNWSNFGTVQSRRLKLFANGFVHATFLVAVMQPGGLDAKLAAVSVFSGAGLLKLSSIAANVYMNSISRVYWNYISKIRDEARANTGQVQLNLFGKTIFNWKRSRVEYKLIHLIPWTINVLSLFALGSSTLFHLPGTEIDVPALQFAGIPVAMYWAKKYARAVADQYNDDPLKEARYRELDESAKGYEEAWQNSFGLDIKEIPSRFKNRFVAVWRRLSGRDKECQELLSPETNKD